MALLACLPLPLCPLFSAAAVLGVILYLAGVGGDSGGGSSTPAAPRPPYWVAVAVLAGAAVVLFLLSLVTEG